MGDCAVRQPVFPPDAELPALFERDGNLAWQVFNEKYADEIIHQLRQLGFDYDSTMDRFVYICEKLREQNYRRLRRIRYAGRCGDLKPWLRTVVKHLSLNWMDHVQGRRRLLKAIQLLPALHQKVFQLYFWKGLSPSRICEQLQLEHRETTLSEVLDALNRIFSVLSQKKLRRLMLNLVRIRREVSLDTVQEWIRVRGAALFQINPEDALIAKETKDRMHHALEDLSSMERIVVHCRFNEGMQIREVAEAVHMSEKEVRRSLRSALKRLKAHAVFMRPARVA